MSSPHTDTNARGYNKLPATTALKSNDLYSPPRA